MIRWRVHYFVQWLLLSHNPSRKTLCILCSEVFQQLPTSFFSFKTMKSLHSLMKQIFFLCPPKTSSFRYQELMKESSRMPLFDLRKLNASLPVPSLPKSCIEVLVLGASDDFIVVNFHIQLIQSIPLFPMPSGFTHLHVFVFAFSFWYNFQNSITKPSWNKSSIATV